MTLDFPFDDILDDPYPERIYKGGCMELDQIQDAIDDFECEQVTYEELVFVLSRLPLRSVRLDPPCSLYLELDDMLDQTQTVLFAGLRPDECDIDGDEIYLWWD